MLKQNFKTKIVKLLSYKYYYYLLLYIKKLLLINFIFNLF